MNFIPEIEMNAFDYNLPQDRIAQKPVSVRDKSKLLVYQNNKIIESVFSSITDFLPSSSLLISNETKVVRSRLLFKKDTGAEIEIFLLDAVQPTNEIQLAFLQGPKVIWKCLVGNSRKWKTGSLKLKIDQGKLEATRIEKTNDYSLVEFNWSPKELSFSQVIEKVGIVPLPPYMNRKAVPEDNDRYQTIYAKTDGSVAAPTAGLHFTPEVLKDLMLKDIEHDTITLHVGAGTFRPVSSNHVSNHQMHSETIQIFKSNIEKIIDYKSRGKKIISVGTTTTRTLESVYWFGVQLLNNQKVGENMMIPQWIPYSEKQNAKSYGTLEVFNAIRDYMKKNHLETLSGQTQLMILPGYDYKVIDILITNFHMPKSTLLLLVSALIGNQWKRVYNYALENNFRFLSYGDACLFFKQ